MSKPPRLNPSDLAPGDLRSAQANLSDLTFHQIESTHSPLFQIGYNLLAELFEPHGEMESRPTLEQRFAWNLAPPTPPNPALHYAMILALDPYNQVAAVRDFTTLVPTPPQPARATVHLSHLWIHPTHRRTGLAGWMRAIPLQNARNLLEQTARPADSPITLVGEMEFSDGKDEARTIRLLAYERAGFLKVDPQRMPYLQPDFRPPALIDSSGGPQPIPMSLILRRVGHETQTHAPAAEIRTLIHDLYTIYATTFRPADMAPLWEKWRASSTLHTPISLLPPTQ